MKLSFFLLILVAIACSQTERKAQKTAKNSIEQIKLTVEDVEEKSIEELRIMRNEIFARHGYIFNSFDLQEYFGSQPWYKPTSKEVNHLLTHVDSTNLKLIIHFENLLKTYAKRSEIPLTDEEHERFKELSSEADNSLKPFTVELLNIVEKFRGKIADTSVFQIVEIDGLPGLDTLQTDIYAQDANTIAVETRFIRNGNKIWSNRYENPYLWISDAEEFQYDTRSPWVTFTTGILYGKPHFEQKTTNLDHSGKEQAFRDYIEDFQGYLVSFGEPETRWGISIWYEPTKSFRTYYQE